MEKKEIAFAVLMVSTLLLPFYAMAQTTGTGNPNNLCDQINDLNEAGGCIESEEAPNLLISTGAVFLIKFGALAGIVILAIVAAYLGLKAKKRNF